MSCGSVAMPHPQLSFDAAVANWVVQQFVHRVQLSQMTDLVMRTALVRGLRLRLFGNGENRSEVNARTPFILN